MAWKDQLNGDPTDWLLETEDAGVRYLAMRDLLDIPADDPELSSMRQQAHKHGPIAAILGNMQPEGYWPKAGAGYLPKYRSSVWSITLLAQLGAQVTDDKRISQACSYIVDHAMAAGGQFSMDTAPSGTIDCLQGNLCWALLEMNYENDRLKTAFEWMARTVTGEGMAPKSEKRAERRYYAGKCGPLFACGANNNQPCAWGAVKVMLAFGRLPKEQRTPMDNRAIQAGVDFLLNPDPVKAEWPSGYAPKPSSNWWKFGFPVFYVTDLLQVVEAMVNLGYAHDPRLGNALELVRSKQDSQGRWMLEYDYTDKTWVDFGKKKQANKWVTLRALRVLKKAG